MRLIHRFVQILIIGISSFAITACMVGPDFHTPRAPKVKNYTETPLPDKTVSTPAAGNAGKSQQFVVGQAIAADWWKLFRSRQLNILISTALANSPSVAAAEAALRQAEETLNAQIGTLLFPNFNAQVNGTRQRFSGATIGGGDVPSTIFNLYNATVNVSYNLDVFGGARRQIEGYRAQVDYQQFQLLAAYLTLTSNIVTTSVTIAALQDQVRASKEILRLQEGQLIIMRKQFNVGGVAYSDVLTQETLVAQTRASIPPLEKNLSQSRHALSALVGDFPNGKLPDIELNALNLPTRLPVSLPSEMVRQRPDVRASEALLHVASAQIGASTANLLPQFPLTGNYGWTSTTPASLFQPINKVWFVTYGLTQPIFQGGALLAQRRGAIAAYDQAAAQYRQTVLQAFQNVADSLRALETDARALRAQKQAEISARNNYHMSQDQYRLGGVNYLSLLNAQQQYQQAVINRIQAQALRYSDTAALFQSLGGGWWNRCGRKT